MKFCIKGVISRKLNFACNLYRKTNYSKWLIQKNGIKI